MAKPPLCSPQARKIGRCCSTSKLKSPDLPSLITQPPLLTLLMNAVALVVCPVALKYKRKIWVLVSCNVKELQFPAIIPCKALAP